MNRLSILTFLLTSFLSLTAQQSFEGKIVYNITYTEIGQDMEGFESFLPKQNILYVQDEKVRTEVPMSFGDPQITVMDSKNESGFMTMDMLGTKIAITYNKDNQDDEEVNSTQSFEYFDDYKIILGYKCQKAVITTTTDGVSTSSTYYYTNELPNLNKDAEGLKGMSLEYTTDTDGTKSTITAISISKEKIDDSYFEIPEGYEEVSIQDLDDFSPFETSEE